MASIVPAVYCCQSCHDIINAMHTIKGEEKESPWKSLGKSHTVHDSKHYLIYIHQDKGQGHEPYTGNTGFMDYK